MSFQLILKCQLGKKEQYVLCQTAIDRVEQKNEVCKEHTLVLEGFKNIIYWIRPVLVRITNFPSGFHCTAHVRIHMLGRQMFVV